MAEVLTALARELRRFDASIGRAAPFAVVGGLAVSVRTEPRFTRDVDLAVAVVSDAEAEALILSLVHGGYRTLAVFEHTSGRLATVRLVPPGGGPEGVLVDLLFASSGLEAEVVAAAEAVEVLPGVVLPVARLGHLLALKLLSVAPDRPNDEADLQALLHVADGPELARCADALALITRRGFARGRDLAAALAARRGRWPR